MTCRCGEELTLDCPERKALMRGKQGSEDGSGSLDGGRNCQSREQQSLEAGRDRWTGSFLYQSLQGHLSPGGLARLRTTRTEEARGLVSGQQALLICCPSDFRTHHLQEGMTSVALYCGILH